LRTAPKLSVGQPRRLVEYSHLFPIYSASYDVVADGQRFVMREPVDEPPQPVIRVVQNWFEEFWDR
jgi:hypothetical protein